MTMTIEMTPEVETGLERKAYQCGQPLSDYVRDLLERDAETPAKDVAQAPLLVTAQGNSRLAAALALARELGPAIMAGTLKPINAADEIEANREEIEANREERMRELDPRG